MSSLKTVTLSLAIVLVSAVSVQAATHPKKAVHHAAPHAMKSSSHAAMARRGAPGADNSADSLNAQSLARSQGTTP